MTPFQFVDVYHKLRINDPKLKLDIYPKVRKYKNGWAAEDIAEANAVIAQVKHKEKHGKDTFFVTKQTDKVSDYEAFYVPSIERAFAGRASPDECRDAIRLAVLGGRIKPGAAQAYAEKWFALDCNAYAGNYLGISPSTYIGAYACGYGKENLSAYKHLIPTVKYLPFQPRPEPSKVNQADALVWFVPPNAEGNRWGHIGLVEDFRLIDGGTKEGGATVWMVDLKIGQWGTEWEIGADEGCHKTHKPKMQLVEDVHAWKPAKDAGAWKDLLTGLKGLGPLKDKKLMAFPTWRKKKRCLVLVLDSSHVLKLGHRGWHCGDTQGV